MWARNWLAGMAPARLPCAHQVQLALPAEHLDQADDVVVLELL
jgi:hypothetical protein